MNPLRVIDLGTVTPEYSLAAEHALLKLHPRFGDILFFYSRDRPCVSAGRFRDVSTTIDVEKVRNDGIPVIKRMSGGSAIFYDRGQLTYSLMLRRSEITEDRASFFRIVCNGIAGSLVSMGIDAVYKSTNDILVNNRKISGSAQFRNGASVMQHGSLLLDADLELMSKYVKDTGNRGYDGLTTILDAIGYVPSRDVIIDSIAKGLSGSLGMVAKTVCLEEDEMAMIRNMCDDTDSHQ